MKKIKYKNNYEMRVDKFLHLEMGISRNKVIKMIRNWKIQINNKWVDKPGQIVVENDMITILDSVQNSEINSIDKEIEIIYEDENYLIINKPSGLLVHPSSFQELDTLANRIKHYFKKNNIHFSKSDFRWGICHRLDKDTSGLLIVAKNIVNQNIFMELIKNKKVRREYIALVHGKLPSKKIRIDVPLIRDEKTGNKMVASKKIDAKSAITNVELIEEFDNFSLIKCEIETGRTHQIRSHLLYIKNPIINDPIYSNNNNNNKTNKYGQYLIAYKLTFIDPFKNIKRNFEIPIDKSFKKYIEENK